MVERRLCSFCGKELEPGNNMYIEKDGTVFWFCSNKCHKDMFDMGRVPRRTIQNQIEAAIRHSRSSATGAVSMKLTTKQISVAIVLVCVLLSSLFIWVILTSPQQQPQQQPPPVLHDRPSDATITMRNEGSSEIRIRLYKNGQMVMDDYLTSGLLGIGWHYIDCGDYGARISTRFSIPSVYGYSTWSDEYVIQGNTIYNGDRITWYYHSNLVVTGECERWSG